MLGFTEYYKATAGNDKNWPNCGSVMAQVPCAKDGLDFTPPGGNSSAIFYEPDAFPAGGTRTTSNMPGTVTAPISGETFTWTSNNIVNVVTVASANARPTEESDQSENEDDNGNKSSNEQDNDSNGNKEQSEDSKDDDESAGSALSLGMTVISGIMILALII